MAACLGPSGGRFRDGGGGYHLPLTSGFAPSSRDWLRHLARAGRARLAAREGVPATDPAERFQAKRTSDGRRRAGTRWRWRACRKAIAILQFKLEGQAFDRRPEWDLGAPRAVALHRSGGRARVEIDGGALPPARYPVSRPLTGAIRASCSDGEGALPRRASPGAFLASRTLWAQMDVTSVSHGPDVAAPRPCARSFTPACRSTRPGRAARVRRRRRAAPAARRCSMRFEVVVQRARSARAPPGGPPSSIAISSSTCGPGRARRASARTGWRRFEDLLRRRPRRPTRRTKNPYFKLAR